MLYHRRVSPTSGQAIFLSRLQTQAHQVLGPACILPHTSTPRILMRCSSRSPVDTSSVCRVGYINSPVTDLLRPVTSVKRGRICHYDDPQYPVCVRCKEKGRGCGGKLPCHQCVNAKLKVNCEFAIAATPMPTAEKKCHECERLGLNCNEAFLSRQNGPSGECVRVLLSGFEMRVAQHTTKPLPSGYTCGHSSFEVCNPVATWPAEFTT